MGMAKIWPSENPKPLTDYDTTLHNWLCRRNKHVTQNLCQSVVRECLANYVKYKASSFLFLFHFFPDSPTEITRGWILMHNGSKHVLWHKEVPYWGTHDHRQHFGVQIYKKNGQKMAFYRRVRAATNRLKTNDIIENWHHWRLSVARSPWLVKQRILFITYSESPQLCIFQRLKTMQRTYQLMHYGYSVLAKFIQYF